MDRSEALRVATEYVNKISAGSGRGLPGASDFAQRVDAVERFARFLMESTEDVQDGPGTRYEDKDGDVWTVQPDGRMKSPAVADTLTRERAEQLFGPLTRIP